jgi:hypothetical protein
VFLSLAEGADLYSVEAAAVGVRRIEARPAEAVALAALHGQSVVDRGLAVAATACRFAEDDLGSIMVHGATTIRPAGAPVEHSLAAGIPCGRRWVRPTTTRRDSYERPSPRRRPP